MQPGGEGLLQAGGQRRRRRRDALVVPRCIRRGPCELDQRQRITGCLAENAGAQDRVQLGRRLIEQRCRGRSAQPLQVEGGEVCSVERGRDVQRERRPPAPLARSPACER